MPAAADRQQHASRQHPAGSSSTMSEKKENQRRFTSGPEFDERASSDSLCPESVKGDWSEADLKEAEPAVLASTAESGIGQSVIRSTWSSG